MRLKSNPRPYTCTSREWLHHILAHTLSTGGHGSLPWLSAFEIRPSLLWIINSVFWLRLIERPISTAFFFVSVCALALLLSSLLTSQPPLGFGTTWWSFLAILFSSYYLIYFFRIFINIIIISLSIPWLIPSAKAAAGLFSFSFLLHTYADEGWL